MRNFAAYDCFPELQLGNLSTISSADSIFIHHVLLQGKGRPILGRAVVKHTVSPCFYYIHFSSICQGKYIQFRHLERRLPVSVLEWCPACHPERSEGSLRPSSQILRCAQDDRPKARAQDDRHYLQMSKLDIFPLTNSKILDIL